MEVQGKNQVLDIVAARAEVEELEQQGEDRTPRNSRDGARCSSSSTNFETVNSPEESCLSASGPNAELRSMRTRLTPFLPVWFRPSQRRAGISAGLFRFGRPGTGIAATTSGPLIQPAALGRRRGELRFLLRCERDTALGLFGHRALDALLETPVAALTL